MRIDVVTIFPRMVEAGLEEGVIGRARTRGVLDIVVRDLRTFTDDRHRTVDDVPFGGGPGMVMKAEPFFAALDAIVADRGTADAVLLMSPVGRRFTQAEARRYAALRHLVLLCGRYEGVDERVRAHVATEEVSIGDYVLSGGEVPALVVIDAIGRLVPGVVGDEQSVDEDSFSRGLFDCPHYTRPADVRGHLVPDVLLSGHHGEIRRWRRREALRLTWERRPELVAEAPLDAEERDWVREWERSRERGERKGSE